MPHCELKHSHDLDNIKMQDVLKDVEDIVLAHDPGAGQTKGRAFSASISRHTHMLMTLTLLAKPHRDAAFVDALKADLVAAVSAHLPRPCWFSIDISFSTRNYHTELLE